MSGTLELASGEASRYWGKVRKTDGCWNWIGGRTTAGYGMILLRQKLRYAHRLSFEMHVGPLSDGLCVLHRCDNPACVNPGHLFAGSKRDNVADMHQKEREARGEMLPQSKLTKEAVVELRQKHAAGVTQRKLAEQYGVSHSVISEAIARKTWAHVP